MINLYFYTTPLAPSYRMSHSPLSISLAGSPLPQSPMPQSHATIFPCHLFPPSSALLSPPAISPSYFLHYHLFCSSLSTVSFHSLLHHFFLYCSLSQPSIFVSPCHVSPPSSTLPFLFTISLCHFLLLSPLTVSCYHLPLSSFSALSCTYISHCLPCHPPISSCYLPSPYFIAISYSPLLHHHILSPPIAVSAITFPSCFQFCSLPLPSPFTVAYCQLLPQLHHSEKHLN